MLRYPSYSIVNKVQKQKTEWLIYPFSGRLKTVKLDKTDILIHLQDKIGHSSKKIEQSHRYFRILTLEN